MKSLIIYCFPHYGIIDNNYDSLSKSNWYLGIGYINPNNSDSENCQIFSIRGTMLTLIGLTDQNTDEFGQNVMLGTLCTHVLTPLAPHKRFVLIV